MSESHQGHSVSEKTRRKLSKSLKGNKNCEGRRHSKQTKEKIGKANSGKVPWIKGRWHSEEAKCKIRAAWARGAYDNRNPAPPFVTYRGAKMRSTWEARLAAVFDAFGWEWEYEAHKFQYELEDGSHTYTPDFYAPHLDCYFDPHWGRDYAGDKFKAVREQCDVALIVLNKELLEAYEGSVKWISE